MARPTSWSNCVTGGVSKVMAALHGQAQQEHAREEGWQLELGDGGTDGNVPLLQEARVEKCRVTAVSGNREVLKENKMQVKEKKPWWKGVWLIERVEKGGGRFVDWVHIASVFTRRPKFGLLGPWLWLVRACC